MKNMTKKGFTLIELLVVIVIIGILATIGVAQFSSYFGKARDAKRKTNVAQARQLIMAHMASTQDATPPASASAAFNIIDKSGLKLTAEQNRPYLYRVDGDKFVVAVCPEAEGEPTIKAGTLDGTYTCEEQGGKMVIENLNEIKKATSAVNGG